MPHLAPVEVAAGALAAAMVAEAQAEAATPVTRGQASEGVEGEGVGGEGEGGEGELLQFAMFPLMSILTRPMKKSLAVASRSHPI